MSLVSLDFQVSWSEDFSEEASVFDAYSEDETRLAYYEDEEGATGDNFYTALPYEVTRSDADDTNHNAISNSSKSPIDSVDTEKDNADKRDEDNKSRDEENKAREFHG